MSMHKKALTDFELEGLQSHGLPTGNPSQCSDSFRNGMAWMQRRLDAALEREQALAAHLSVLATKGDWLAASCDVCTCDDVGVQLDHWDSAKKQAPHTSLTHRDLIKQAEALETLADSLSLGGDRNVIDKPAIYLRATELRQRAANIQETGQ